MPDEAPQSETARIQFQGSDFFQLFDESYRQVDDLFKCIFDTLKDITKKINNFNMNKVK